MDWNIIFSGIVSFATVVYAILTWGLVSETKKMRESQFRPHISITFEPREEYINWINLKIKNDGFGSAYNVRFKLLSKLDYEDGKKFSETGLMKNGLMHLARNQEIKFFYTNIVGNKSAEKPIEIEVTYNGAFKKYKETFIIDFNEIIGMRQLGEPPLHKMSRNIEEMSRNIEEMSRNIGHIRNDIRNDKIKNRIKKRKLK